MFLFFSSFFFFVLFLYSEQKTHMLCYVVYFKDIYKDLILFLSLSLHTRSIINDYIFKVFLDKLLYRDCSKRKYKYTEIRISQN